MIRCLFFVLNTIFQQFKDDETVNINETTKNLELITEDSINQENNDENFGNFLTLFLVT